MEHIQHAAATTLRTLQANAARAPATPNTSQNSECPFCRGVGWIRHVIGEHDGVTQCVCLKQKIVRAKIAALPERFRTSSFASYIPRDDAQAAALYEICRHVFGNFYLCGNYGRGKTHLASA